MTRKIDGTVHIANDVLADLAGFAAMECYGIVGMANPSLRDGMAQLLSRDKLRKGVAIVPGEDGVTTDLYVVVEHGTSMTQVAANLQDRVRYVLSSYADVQVADVRVHVMGVKVRS
jgi:uncharacterized alkaline shock family protein YloU